MVLALPKIIAAPMAGGPSTPELVNAVEFGFLAFGTCSVDEAHDQMLATCGDYGVNLFYPQTEQPDPDEVVAISTELGAEVPEVDFTSGFPAKFQAALEALEAGYGPRVVSSTFGCFSEAEIQALRDRGAEAWVTVTSVAEAQSACRRRPDRLIVQGPEAGGHRATWSIVEQPDQRPLPELLTAVRSVTDLPLIAAGGVRDRAAADALIAKGTQAVACGSAYLLADEAGTSTANRKLLRAGGSSISTRALSGRYARGLETAFTRAHPDMPALYPYLNALLKDKRNNPDYAYCLVGVEPEKIQEGKARDVI